MTKFCRDGDECGRCIAGGEILAADLAQVHEGIQGIHGIERGDPELEDSGTQALGDPCGGETLFVWEMMEECAFR